MCVTHDLTLAAKARRVSQHLGDDLPEGVAGAAIMKTDGHLLVLVSTTAARQLCAEHAAQLQEAQHGKRQGAPREAMEGHRHAS